MKGWVFEATAQNFDVAWRVAYLISRYGPMPYRELLCLSAFEVDWDTDEAHQFAAEFGKGVEVKGEL